MQLYKSVKVQQQSKN